METVLHVYMSECYDNVLLKDKLLGMLTNASYDFIFLQ